MKNQVEMSDQTSSERWHTTHRRADQPGIDLDRTPHIRITRRIPEIRRPSSPVLIHHPILLIKRRLQVRDPYYIDDRDEQSRTKRPYDDVFLFPFHPDPG